MLGSPKPDDGEGEALKELPGESIPLDPFVLTLNTEDGQVRAKAQPPQPLARQVRGRGQP